MFFLFFANACVEDTAQDSSAPAGVWIKRLQPERAQQGERLTLVGEGFGASFSEETRVFVSGHCATILQWSSERVVIRVPQGSGVGDRLVVLQTAGRTSNATPLLILGENLPQRPEEGCPTP